MKLKWCDKYDSKQKLVMKPITAKFDRLVEKSWLKKIDAPSLSHYNAFLYNTMANVTLNDVSSNSLYFEFSHLEDSLNENLQVDWKWYFLVKSLRLFPNINHKMAIWVKRGGPLKCVYIYEILTLYLVKILCVYWNSRAELFILKMLGIKNWKTPYTLM